MPQFGRRTAWQALGDEEAGADPARFAAAAMVFADLAPIYVRRFFEGLRHPARNKGR